MTSNDVRELEDKVTLNLFMNRYGFQAVKGKGIYLYDTEGNRWEDWHAGIAVNNLGYRHPKMEKAMKKMAEGVYHTSGYVVHENPVRLAEKLLELTGMSRVFFQSTGSEAVEAAIKVSRAWGNQQKKKRIKLLGLKGSFHGRSTGAVSLTGQPAYQEPFLPLLPEVYHVAPNDIGALKKTLNTSFAAFFVEPVMGEGGVVPLSQEYQQAIADLCEKTGTLLVVDEVQSGAGRCGTWLASEGSPLKADILLQAKGIAGGLPLSVWMVNERLREVLKPGQHSGTYLGNPFVTGVALAVVKAIVKEGIPNVQALAPKMEAGLREIQSSFPHITEVRGKGFFWGIELAENAREAWQAALSRRMVVNLCRGNVLRLSPPLILSEKQMNRGLEMLFDSIKETAPG